MSINKVFSAVRHTLGIQTKAEKVAQKQLNAELQAAADKLNGPKRDLYVKNLDGSIKHLTVTDKEVEEINKGHERILRKAGIPDINSNPNYDRHNQERMNDVWNRYNRD